MRMSFGKAILAVGVLAAIGIGVWNAIEIDRLRERLSEAEAAKPIAETEPTPEFDIPKELREQPFLPTTVAPPDILLVNVTNDSLRPSIRGEYLIRPDGTVVLGEYGSVYVSGKTLPQVKAAVEEHLAKFVNKPDVSVDVASFNSKWYYVITDLGGNGEQVVRLPSTGNETVMDALAGIGGLPADTERKVWIVRTTPHGMNQILPVNWKGIASRGHARTNYQILSGDRVNIMMK